MKRLTLVAVAVVMGFTMAGCKKAVVKKIVTSEDVSKTLSVTLCEKYASCQTDAGFNKEQCQLDISSGLTERLKTKTDLKLEQAALDACNKAIQTAKCEILTSDTPPVGCEFLQ